MAQIEMSLRRALEECTLPLLRKIAASHALPVEDSTLRTELIDALEAGLLKQDQLPRQLSLLSAGEIAVLRFTRAQDWIAKAFLVDRRFPRRQPGSDQPEVATQPGTVSLLQKGLLFRGFVSLGEWRGEVYYVPEELRQMIATVLPAPDFTDRPRLAPKESPENVPPSYLFYDIFCLFSFLRRASRKLSGDGLSSQELGRLAREAGTRIEKQSSDWKRWEFLLHLCIAGGWVRRHGQQLRPTRRAHQLLELGPSEAKKALLETYLRDRGWSDLSAIGKVRQPVGSERIREPSSRRVTLHHLRAMIDGWADEDSFVEALHLVEPDVLRQDYASLSWALTDIASGVELQGPESWDSVEGEWIRYLLRGPLRWLDVVEWGLDDAGRERAFRLAARAGATEDARSGVTLDDKMELSAARDGDLSLTYRLEPYAALQRRGPTSSYYSLSRASVLAGLESGGTVEELTALLEKLALPGSPAERAARRALEWASEFGRFSLEAALILTTATVEDAEWLRESDEFRHCLRSRVGPRSYSVVVERQWELIEKLRRAGHAPRVAASARFHPAKAATRDLELLKECLLAVRVLTGLQSELDANFLSLARRLESALDPEGVQEVNQKADELSPRGTTR